MLIGGIHGNEREGGRHLEEVLPFLGKGQWRVRVVEDLNPDGTWRGARGTSKGVDPNRNWPASNFRPSPLRGPEPLSEPCVAAVHADILRFAPDIVIVLHSTGRGPFVNFDGPAGPWAETFAAAASAAGSTFWSVEPSMGYPTPGSLGTWFGVDGNRPILTIEFARGCSSLESGPALRAGLQAVIASSLTDPPEVYSVR